MAQIAVVTFIKFFLMLLGKLLIVVGCTAVAFMWIESMDDGPRYIVVPLLLVAFLSYVMTCFFLNVYEMCISTILLCFCVDRKRNDGSVEKPYIMPDSLKRALRVTNKTAADEDPGNKKGDGKGKSGSNKAEMAKNAAEAGAAGGGGGDGGGGKGGGDGKGGGGGGDGGYGGKSDKPQTASQKIAAIEAQEATKVQALFRGRSMRKKKDEEKKKGKC